jgi:4-amino-4-deoxy-L-arabinose transferase-like glycosyltransferase
MSSDLREAASGRRPVPGIELALVFLLSLAVLLPGVWTYSLVDPWETHYAEVARRMLQDDDLVHTQWSNEGFRSKPVLTFWLMAGSMAALDVGDGGGYSGEMVSSGRVLLAIRLPFVLFGVLGLCMAWWMLARLVSRRAAWLGLLVLGTTPFYLLVARQGITDMSLVGSMIGAIAMFVVANEVGDAPPPTIATFGRIRRVVVDHRHLLWGLVGAFLVWQAAYYVVYFTRSPRLAGVQLGGLHPGGLIAVAMLIGVGLLAAMEAPRRRVRAVAYWIATALTGLVPLGAARVVSAAVDGRTHELAEVPRTTTARQVYLLWFWVLLGISVLGKGLPALGIVGIVCAFYVILLGRWRDLLADRFELVRGFALVLLITVPWHVAMFFKDGRRFVTDYFVRHLWNRAAVGVHGERGTFDFLVSQLGYGMFLWAALVPAALAALVLRVRTDTPEGRVRLVIAMWAVTSVAFFSIVQTKFHHYILPAVPALALAIGLWLDDLLAGRARRVGVAALVGIGVVLVLANDMMDEQKQWIEMFVYRYDRPWPSGAPWEVDLASGFLALGLAGAAALALLAWRRAARLGVIALCAVAFATAMWSIHVYMPIAGRHWGMWDAMRQYYDQRDLHGMKLVYHGARQLADDWARGDGVRSRWTIRTHVPEALPEGRPMVLRITVYDAAGQQVEHELALTGRVSRIDRKRAAVEVALPAEEVARLAPLVGAGRRAPRSSRPPIRAVDGDRLLAWQLYWRGENFWSGDEIWGPLPEMKTSFNEFVNKGAKPEVYLADPELAPPGRRYWVITEAGRAAGIRSALPTERAKETYRIENTASNKFTLASFEL